MKTLKFTPVLAEKILRGEKTTTWRLFDDKDLKTGDSLIFLRQDTKEEFARATALLVTETKLGKLGSEHRDGHETYKTEEEMYKTFEKYYNRKVDKDTEVKIIKFELKQY